MAFGLKNCPGALDQKKRYSYHEKKKKKRFYFLSSWSAYNIYIYITDKDARSMFLCSWKNKNMSLNTGTQKGPYFKSQLGP